MACIPSAKYVACLAFGLQTVYAAHCRWVQSTRMMYRRLLLLLIMGNIHYGIKHFVVCEVHLICTKRGQGACCLLAVSGRLQDGWGDCS